MTPVRRRAAGLTLRAPLACAVAVGAMSGCTSGDSGAPNSIGLTTYAPAARANSVDIGGTTLTGSTLRVRSRRGHVVVLNVWASWCRPCRTESPIMAAAARRFAGAGVRFVGIDERDDAGKARGFAAAAGARYPQLFDPAGVILSRLPLLPQAGIPSTLVLDRTGRPVARIIGPATDRLLDRAVRAARPSG